MARGSFPFLVFAGSSRTPEGHAVRLSTPIPNSVPAIDLANAVKEDAEGRRDFAWFACWGSPSGNVNRAVADENRERLELASMLAKDRQTKLATERCLLKARAHERRAAVRQPSVSIPGA